MKPSKRGKIIKTNLNKQQIFILQLVKFTQAKWQSTFVWVSELSSNNTCSYRISYMKHTLSHFATSAKRVSYWANVAFFSFLDVFIALFLNKSQTQLVLQKEENSRRYSNFVFFVFFLLLLFLFFFAD